MSKTELLQNIQQLASQCHSLACEQEIGEERTELFEIYNVLRNLGRKGYAVEVGESMNPLLNLLSHDEDEDEDEEWEDEE